MRYELCIPHVRTLTGKYAVILFSFYTDRKIVLSLVPQGTVLRYISEGPLGGASGL